MNVDKSTVSDVTGSPSKPSQNVVNVSENKPETRSAEQHVHGAANLAIALDGKTVTVELETPVYNIVGFEYAPKTNAQERAVENAEKRLRNSENLIKFSDKARCTFQSKNPPFDMYAIWDDHDDEHDHEEKDGHDDHGHDEGHQKKTEVDHSHDNDHDSHKGEHNSVILTYDFECNFPDDLTEARITALETFPNFMDIDVVFLGPSSQKAFEVNRNDPVIRLRGN